MLTYTSPSDIACPLPYNTGRRRRRLVASLSPTMAYAEEGDTVIIQHVAPDGTKSVPMLLVVEQAPMKEVEVSVHIDDDVPVRDDVDDKIMANKSTVGRSLLQRLQRRLRMSTNHPRTTTTTQGQYPSDVQKKLDSLRNNQPKLTISTTELDDTARRRFVQKTCSSLSSTVQENKGHRHLFFDYWPSHSGSGSGSMDESCKVAQPDDASHFEEWLSTRYENTAKVKFHPAEKTRHHVDEEVTIDGSPSDLLSAQYTVQTSTDTMSNPNQRIQTPHEITSKSCSFNFDFFGGDMLNSVAETVSQIKSLRTYGSEDYDADSDYSDDDSEDDDANSYSSEESSQLSYIERIR